jgi:hypothetical protein
LATEKSGVQHRIASVIQPTPATSFEFGVRFVIP